MGLNKNNLNTNGANSGTAQSATTRKNGRHNPFLKSLPFPFKEQANLLTPTTSPCSLPQQYKFTIKKNQSITTSSIMNTSKYNTPWVSIKNKIVSASCCKGVLEKGTWDKMRIRNPKAIPNRDSNVPMDYMLNQQLQEMEHQKTNKAIKDNS